MQKDEEFVTCGSDIIGPDGKYQNPFFKKNDKSVGIQYTHLRPFYITAISCRVAFLKLLKSLLRNIIKTTK